MILPMIQSKTQVASAPNWKGVEQRTQNQQKLYMRRGSKLALSLSLSPDRQSSRLSVFLSVTAVVGHYVHMINICNRTNKKIIIKMI